MSKKTTKAFGNIGKVPTIPKGWRLSGVFCVGKWWNCGTMHSVDDWHWGLGVPGEITMYTIEKVEDESPEAEDVYVGGRKSREAAQAADVGGRKDDSGKPRSAEVLDGFKRALNAVCAVGTWGGEVAYPDKPFDNWKNVPDGVRRYSNAAARHRLAMEDNDVSGLPHRFHVVWNELAALELWLKEKEDART